MSARIYLTMDLVGCRFDRLVVIRRASATSSRNIRWECLCDCGEMTVVQGGSLKNGRTRSCGCLQKEIATKHGMEDTLTYTTWAQMKTRCLNPRHRWYSYYGGRGIRVCRRWLQFENFLADMGVKPKGMTLDRLDNSGDYSSGNCRWATREVQQNNRRNTRFLLFRGKRQSVMQWCRELGIAERLIRGRLRLGWSPERIFTEPTDFKRSTRA